MNDQSEGWRTLSTELICKTPFLQVSREQVATPSRPDGVEWMVVRRKTAAVIAPRTSEGRYILIQQERVAVRTTTWEFPAGQVDVGSGTAAVRETALRELSEEAGVECRGELIPLGFFYSSVGFTDECCQLFLATDVAKHEFGVSHDEHEAILGIREFTAEELREMIAEGRIFDSNTLAVYSRLVAKGLLE